MKACYFIPDGTIAVDASNFATLALAKADGAGGALTTLGDVDTDSGNDNYAGAQGVEKQLTEVDTGDTLVAGDWLVFKVTKAGTGVVVTRASVVVEYTVD